MNDPLQSLLFAANLPKHNLPATSRYYRVETATIDGADGVPTIYLKRRFIPQATQFQTRQIHQVQAGERIDNIAAHYLGDPEQFWQIADANGSMRADELSEQEGNLIKIPLNIGLNGL
jgi:hypothetical protein